MHLPAIHIPSYTQGDAGYVSTIALPPSGPAYRVPTARDVIIVMQITLLTLFYPLLCQVVLSTFSCTHISPLGVTSLITKREAGAEAKSLQSA